MIAALALFLIPTLLFVIGFLYETYLSFVRLKNPKAGKSGYLSATWEVTHTLLVFAVVMLLMMYTQVIDEISTAIFTATFIAAVALGLRAFFYIYIFYVRTSTKTSWIDWAFAFTHVVAALFLVIVVLQSVWYVVRNNPPVNSQFLPYFIPGLLVVLVLCIIPIVTLYKTK